ncbi:helicase-related protein [Amycolatopsis sp. H20-H5]|uniref:helicase-related protein n=1 Tax=Amycolatopsis sp. H20-H5 TaxID=3046309 RepID=UPI002DBA482E|nr:helicase-related protein [Amycolatopsis sp. H20-H5]MEC3978175.1 helicase-related protein [Amycolatopsis sp. H20-H5]
MLKVVDFLRYVIDRDKLTIVEHLQHMGRDPFFLVAATGLGKTVAVPIHVLVRLMESIGADPGPQPRVWVVEPRIPIAVDQAQFMNSLWKKYLSVKKERALPPLFGSISSRGKSNPDAPIKFVTTGIFELMAKGEELTPARDRVIIDEAHVTVEQNAGVELGIALARKAGVPVDYMSATVDTTSISEDLYVRDIVRADKQRYVVWKHNLLQPLRDALPQLIMETLLKPDTSSAYFPRRNGYQQTDDVIAAVSESDRSHGMLAIVNSFAGENSDVKRLASIIQKVAPDLPILQLAGEVVRDERRSAEFERKLRHIEQEKKNYIILATSVVEMGITFPTLDFVVTMDSGYDQETIGDQTFPVVAPLGVNSLLQRIGRVGRRRPGIAYISREVGADYADLDDDELNRNGLQYEAISFPLAAAPLTDLAYYACRHEWDDLGQWVAGLGLPSRLHENADRLVYLQDQIEMFEGLGIAADARITPFGVHMERWIGQTDLAYAVQLQKRFFEDASLTEVMFWVVGTALSNTSVRALRASHDFFVDYTGEHAAIAHELEFWRGFDHEDIAVFSVVCAAAAAIPMAFFGGGDVVFDDWDDLEFRRWCGLLSMDSRKFRKAAVSVADTLKLFAKVNGKTPRFAELFGSAAMPTLKTLPWGAMLRDFPEEQLRRQLSSLIGAAVVVLEKDDRGNFTWEDSVHGRSGSLAQDDTPILLQGGMYLARLIPGRQAKGEIESWRLTHLATLPPPIEVEKAAEVKEEAGKKKWWWRVTEWLDD